MMANFFFGTTDITLNMVIYAQYVIYVHNGDFSVVNTCYAIEFSKVYC